MKSMKRSRKTRIYIKCGECNKLMSLEFWRKTHFGAAHPNIKNPRYIDLDNKPFTDFLSPKKKKERIFVTKIINCCHLTGYITSSFAVKL